MKDIKTLSQSQQEKILAQHITDLKRDHKSMEDKDVAYDLGYAMALCNSLGRKKLTDLVLNRFESHAY